MTPQYPNDARAVANEVIRLAHAKPTRITNLEVQKLIYFAHGFMLALERKPLFWQNVIAWPKGPVVIDVYEALKIYGRDPILEPIIMPGLIAPDENSSRVIKLAYDRMSKHTPGRLIRISHDPNGPWFKVYNERGMNQVIDTELIRHYFTSLIK